MPRAICATAGASARNAFSRRSRQPSSQQLQQVRIEFSPITINLEVSWLPVVERLSDVQGGTSDLLGLPLLVTRLLLQLQPEQGGGGSTPVACVFSVLGCLCTPDSPQQTPPTAHWPEMGQMASPSSKEGGKFDLASGPLLRRKPQKKGN